MIMRTQEEILQRFEDVAEDDFFGTKRSDLLDFMNYGNAKQYLKEGVTEEEWEKAVKETETPEKQIRNYMEFAWGKANGCRGLSATRSIDHIETWVWLHGDDELIKKLEETEYNHYGKEKLIVVCEHFGIDWKKLDDGERKNTDY